MAGYGPVDQNGQTTLIRIQDDLTRLFEGARASVRRGFSRNLAARLARLDASCATAGMLSTLERIITRWRLVEYRPTLEDDRQPAGKTSLRGRGFWKSQLGKVFPAQSHRRNRCLASRRDSGHGGSDQAGAWSG